MYMFMTKMNGSYANQSTYALLPILVHQSIIHSTNINVYMCQTLCYVGN